ncbi:hypothetical protein GWI33_006691 [Rhynchophorus ferrugineus]|uniref:Uncharacterized protein n=1 Tax=Rhynchophorus ferrugineus TaxID=354439 RepID=A0A834IKR3_RHYFE|nr:hypothetical protein GWI33_006691 [Rhynchophorus ferrugineus]
MQYRPRESWLQQCALFVMTARDYGEDESGKVSGCPQWFVVISEVQDRLISTRRLQQLLFLMILSQVPQ